MADALPMVSRWGSDMTADAYLDPVGFKSKSILNLCWTVATIVHELSWYVAHPIYTIRRATLRS